MALQTDDFPEESRPLIEELRAKISKSQTPGSGTLKEDLFFQPTAASQKVNNKVLPPYWLGLLKDYLSRTDPNCDQNSISAEAHVAQEIKHQGETFSAWSRSRKHSTIYYCEPTGETWAGRIAGIFTHSRISNREPKVETFFLMERFKAFNPTSKMSDPYEAYSSAGKLFLPDTYDGLMIIPFSDVLFHFASYEYCLSEEENAMLALPLAKW
ncbi:hypothetical protein BJ165DRAFT_1534580 [Panaeolus papilionaceus]|nr:hypothetical protein BJ165DRAFT_1534580 [Panaeolus papilionaceus]